MSGFIDPPCLTADLPGISGAIKQQPADFVVEEIPAYEPSGEGGHLFLWIEKESHTTEEVTRHLARTLGVAPREVGTAGLKDRQAVTRQYFSVPASCQENVSAIETESIRLLDARKHTNKLRTGHLRGNRFTILVRDPQDIENLSRIAARITETGFPNYFGPQRFGRDGRTAREGFELLSGERAPKSFPPKKRRYLTRLVISAAQAALFNEILAGRVEDNLLCRLLPGDVAQVTESGGLFVVDDAAIEQPRYDAREIVPTGPMFGPKMKAPAGEVAAREEKALAGAGLTLDSFATFKKIAAGTRRPLVVWPGQFSTEVVNEGVRFEFTLPSGSYATVLLREFIKFV